MALLMEAGSKPTTHNEIADLEAIAALKESSARELKEEGNNHLKKGKKYYSDAIDCYTRALDQKALSEAESSILYANRAHVNLLLGNYRRALTDSEEALELYPANVKALYRATKAAMHLNLLAEAKSYCEKGIEHEPNNEELKKLLRKIDLRKIEQEQLEADVSNAVLKAKGLLLAIEERKLKMGKAVFRQLTGLRKPELDKDKILHWPVLLLYVEVMSSDFIEDFAETDMFSVHLDNMFAQGSPPLQWDKENNYTREAIEVYYGAGDEASLSKAEILQYLLEGTPGAQAESIVEEEVDAITSPGIKGQGSTSWIKVNEKRMLYDVLKEANFTITGIPVFYVVSKKSSFYKEFRAGKWLPPW